MQSFGVPTTILLKIKIKITRKTKKTADLSTNTISSPKIGFENRHYCAAREQSSALVSSMENHVEDLANRERPDLSHPEEKGPNLMSK